MPADPAGDAMHLALASYHKCDFLVTWNCQHLANANKFGHIRRINTLLGFWLFAIIEAKPKSCHTRLKCVFDDCVHYGDHTPSAGSV